MRRLQPWKLVAYYVGTVSPSKALSQHPPTPPSDPAYGCTLDDLRAKLLNHYLQSLLQIKKILEHVSLTLGLCFMAQTMRYGAKKGQRLPKKSL